LNIILLILLIFMSITGGYGYLAYREAQQQIFHAEEAKRKAQHKAVLADQAAQHAAQQVQLATSPTRPSRKKLCVLHPIAVFSVPERARNPQWQCD